LVSQSPDKNQQGKTISRHIAVSIIAFSHQFVDRMIGRKKDSPTPVHVMLARGYQLRDDATRGKRSRAWTSLPGCPATAGEMDYHNE
jgi:hypothetical protein